MIVGSPDYELLETDGHQAKEKVNKAVIKVYLFVCLLLLGLFRGNISQLHRECKTPMGPGDYNEIEFFLLFPGIETET